MPNMNLGEARVDVIVPCYNYGRFLAQCIDSVLSQSVPVRVLILDDASQEYTEQVGRSLAAQHKAVEYRRHSENKGHIATYNEGIEWLDSEYMILLSADDMLAAGSLGAALPILVAHPAVTLLYGQAVKFVDAPPALSPPASPPQLTIIQGWRFIEELCRTNENPIASPAAAIVRTSTQRQVGGYLRDLPHSGDREMWLRFGAHGDVGLVAMPVGLYRQHKTNMSSAYYRTPIRAIHQQYLAFELFFDRFGHLSAESPRLRALARRTVGLSALWTMSEALDSGDQIEVNEYFALISRVCPELMKETSIRNVRIKRLFGPRMWPIIRNVLMKNRHNCRASRSVT